MNLRDRIAEALNRDVVSLTPRAEGDAASAYTCEFDDGSRAFVKTVSSGAPFAMEALGLERLKVPGGVRVPEVLAVDDRFLVLEEITFGRPGPDFQSRLGHQLATTHLNTRHSAYGFDRDHFIGITLQINQPWVEAAPGAWAEFWWTHRLEPMLRRLDDPGLSRLGDALTSRLPDLLGPSDEPPGLIHGDLWSGNVAADRNGSPVMFDPAPSYSHREAELGMTRMFGGFTPDFYDAYTEAAPLPEGWRDRLDLHMLYHVLNHAVIFGGGYCGQATSILKRYV